MSSKSFHQALIHQVSMNAIIYRFTRRYIRNIVRCLLVYAVCQLSVWNVATAEEVSRNYQRFTTFFDAGFKIPAKVLGPMVREEVREEPNQYTDIGQSMRITRHYYHGILQTFYENSNTPNEIEVNSPRIELPFKIRVGTEKEKVLSVMGCTELTANKLSCQYSAQRVEFQFEHEKLSSIHWLVIGW